MYNRITLIGNATKDAELRYTPSGTAVATCRIAVTTRFGTKEQPKEETLYIDFVVWGKFGETVAQYLNKGKQILVEGRLTERSWEKDGQKHSKMEINAQIVRLLSGKNTGQSGPAAPADTPPEGSDIEPF